MTYVGAVPTTGDFKKLDSITTSSATTFNLRQNSVAVYPQSANHCIVSLNGVIQAPIDAFTIVNDTIVFASPGLTSSDVINFILVLGNVNDIGVPSDDTVSTAKLQANAVTSAKIASGVIPTLRPNAKPLIVNGNCAVSQRAITKTSASGYTTVDRFRNFQDDGVVTTTQESLTSGNAYINGFANAFKIDVTTADSSVANNHLAGIQYKFEGQDLQVFKKGTANAEKFTLAFWIKSTKTGTYICELEDEDNSRNNSQSYTVSSSNTWEHKVINFPADTTGAFGDDNGNSLKINWFLNAGTDYTSGSLQTAWGSETAANRCVGQVNALDNTSNNIHITGVQLEVGEYTSSTLPPFQHESYGDNLNRCQRYYYKLVEGNNEPVCMGGMYSSGIFFGGVSFPTTMRTSPTADVVTGTDYWRIDAENGNDTCDALGINRDYNTQLILEVQTNLSRTGGVAGSCRTNNSSSYVGFTAEL